MKLIVGLGNPDKKYDKTRHNAGFVVVDELSSLAKDPAAKSVKLLKSDKFMNESGDAVKRFVEFYKTSPEDLYVVHDDLDIKLGEYKIQKGRGPKLHKGVLSIEEKLGESEFWRIRIGIENRERASGPDGPMAQRGEAYVLQNFDKEEFDEIIEVAHKIWGELKNKVV